MKKINMKKTIVYMLSSTLAFGVASVPVVANSVSAQSVDAANYTYTVTPLLAPFNEYFFVKTENPDPTSFRFVDKSSKYSKNSSLSLDWDDWNDTIKLYEDINYENEQIGRVDGGYIFRSYDTDGGEIVLQTKTETYDSLYGQWDVTWNDTSLKFKLPELKDDVDYLIDTYAVESEFFDNMDAVQSGFTSICLYSGSNVRGTLEKVEPFWSLSSSPHKDQVFYIQSPYTRKDNKKLFATAIYPFRFDSLGFPSVMGTVATRLESSSSYVWNSNIHAYIDVTYNGKTKVYGGCGIGEGQGISKDDIKQYFEFGANATKITLADMRQLLDEYSAIKMEDDVPREDALTWEGVCDKADNGTWVRLMALNNVYGETSSGYAYLYKIDDGNNFSTDSAGNNGSELYWSGELGYASDTWVDGRYVDAWEIFVLGEKFEDHQTSNIILKNVMIPQITYEMILNYDTGEYEYHILDIVEKEKTVKFRYSADKQIWIAGEEAFEESSANYTKLVTLAEGGVIDAKYVDMVSLTLEEVKALQVDKNTNVKPEEYLIYDGLAEAGTSLKDHKHDYKSEITKQPTCSEQGSTAYTCNICDDSYIKQIAKKAHTYTKKVIAPTYTTRGYTLNQCSVCGASYKNKYTDRKTVPSVKVKTTYESSTSTVRLNWSRISGVNGYSIYRYNTFSRKWQWIKSISGSNNLSYKDSGLKSGQIYQYKIKAYAKSGSTTYYGNYSNTVKVATKPSKIKITKVSKGKTSLRIYWGNVDCSGYKIQKYNMTKKKWEDVKVLTSKTSSFLFKNLKKKTNYKIRVSAYRNDGRRNIYGSWRNYSFKTH